MMTRVEFSKVDTNHHQLESPNPRFLGSIAPKTRSKSTAGQKVLYAILAPSVMPGVRVGRVQRSR